MEASPKVTVIPARLRMSAAGQAAVSAARRVAAYARVSTDSDEQFTSFEAQVEYYAKQINARTDWSLVKVYTDEGISGTNTKKRDGFNAMIADAMSGRIDLIITKSVSRFARNTVDTLTTVRKLKERGVEVFFEKENIYTMDSKGELLITIMSSLAQEESRSISENVAWGKRAKAAEGRVYLPYKQFLGYRKGEGGKPEIVEEEAQIVRRIYTLFLEGKTPYGIGKALQRTGTLSPGGNERWQHGTIVSILTNEKYKGDAILQKTFCTDFLTKKMKRNEGELPQYYVEGSHPGIVPAEVFDEVQIELARRKESGYTAREHCFSGRILCADCGSPYIEKVWHSTSQYKRRIWQCARKYKNAERCTTPHLYEDEIQAAFLRIMNGMIADKDAVLADYERMAKLLTDTRALDAEGKAISDECEVVQGLIQQAIRENASTPLKQDEYTLRFNALHDRQTALRERNAQIENERIQRKIKRERILAFIDRLRAADGLLTEFDEGLWNATVESVTVQADGGLMFRFRDGREVCYAYKKRMALSHYGWRHYLSIFRGSRVIHIIAINSITPLSETQLARLYAPSRNMGQQPYQIALHL